MPELNDIIVPISPLINNQYPEVYRDEADLLILFTKAYYEYLEQSDKEKPNVCFIILLSSFVVVVIVVVVFC